MYIESWNNWTYFDNNRALLADDTGGLVLLNDVGVFGVVPIFLVGILVGVDSSLLASDTDEPWRETGLLVGRDDVEGVKLDLIGIDVFVYNGVLEGVLRPALTESEWSESAVVEPCRDFDK